MRIAFIGDSLTEGIPGVPFFEIVRTRMPEHTLVNLGRGNDTVVSLYRRLKRIHWNEPFDLAFLWIGVNDVSREVALPAHRLFTLLRGQRRAWDSSEFRDYYQETLDLLCPVAKKIITVSPLLRGEDMSSAWNQRLAFLSDIIEELTGHCDNAQYFDLRARFVRELAGKPLSRYRTRSTLRVALDILALRKPEQVDRESARRGLHFTLDGLHLNSAGATIVAEEFIRVIQDQQPSSRLATSEPKMSR